ncbi:hypothetical protein JXQ31_14675 [candidate division KSB1 bacterium]|nr:hypothetical protein [candidate division KSB1 bacterium]
MKTKRWFVLLGLLVVFGLQNIGCDRMPSPTAPSDLSVQTNDEIAAKRKAPNVDLEPLEGLTIVKSWSDEKLIRYYQGGALGKKNVAFLYIFPETMSTGEDTKVSAQVFLTSEDQLIFNFQPDYLSFSEPANLYLNYKLLYDKLNGNENDTFVLSWWNPDTGEWEEITSSDTNNQEFKWDKRKKFVSFPIDHFSIYLISKD